MPDVQFNEFDNMPRPAYAFQGAKQSFLIRLALKLGAKDERQANAALLIAGIIFFAVSIGIFYVQLKGPSAPSIPSGEIPMGFDEFGNPIGF